MYVLPHFFLLTGSTPYRANTASNVEKLTRKMARQAALKFFDVGSEYNAHRVNRDEYPQYGQGMEMFVERFRRLRLPTTYSPIANRARLRRQRLNESEY